MHNDGLSRHNTALLWAHLYYDAMWWQTPFDSHLIGAGVSVLLASIFEELIY